MRLHNEPRRTPSLQSRLLAATMPLTLRPLTTVLPHNRLGVLAGRRIVSTTLAAAGPTVPGTTIRAVRKPASRGPVVRGEWVLGPGAVTATAADQVLLYVHGSAYAICSARTHRGITSALSDRTGLPVFACDYRLAPRHRFPAAADDVRAAYEWLLDQGYAPGSVVLAGDSAGGHLITDLTLQLLREGRTPPAALAMLSPLYDVTLGLAFQQEVSNRDPMTSARYAAKLVGLYTAGVDPCHERLELSFAGIDGFPPTLIHAGSREMLLGDSLALAEEIAGSGAEVELTVWPGQMHVFQALTRLLPEANGALADVADFIGRSLASPAVALRAVKEA
jgi:monoterpene epsilon-lactone hydrolase